jgi:MoaA/NifB/PqqE/SkfB family radical SAM enzyme
MPAKTLLGQVKKLRESDAFAILLHPKVIANYRLYQRELKERPLVMKSQPPGVGIEMTNRCNLACIQCLRSLGLKPYKLGDMDFENYKKILAQFPNAINISLNGFGEPMMHKRFFDMVAYTRKVQPWAKVGIYTNGMLLDQEKCDLSISCGLTEMNISIDAAYPDTYRRVRRGGKLDVLHENIRRLIKTREDHRSKFPRIGLNFVMVNDNEGELVPFVEQAVDFGVDYMNCITWASYDWGFKNKRSKDSYMRELDAAHKRMEDLGLPCRSFPKMSTTWTDPTKPFFCDFYWGENFQVNYNGDITLGCCTPFKETFSYGNVLETSFKEIWNGPLYQRNRDMANKRQTPNAACASCDRFCKSFFSDDHEGSFVSLNELAVSGRR